MCGISVLISFREDLDLNQIIPMTLLVKHRGPDDEGYAFFFSNQDEYKSQCYGGLDTPREVYEAGLPYSPGSRFTDGCIEKKPSIAMGHRRLSIIDLSPSGHQPMCYEKGRYWIVYNGELYNFDSLKEELKNAGHEFVSCSDTEVILASYAQWGRECLNKFNGMFAFVIFDSLKGTIFAARDRFGIKPLYYWYSPEGFLAFASEIKQFTALKGWKAFLNEQRAYDFLVFGLTDHSEETMFEGVYQLRGGQAIECSIGELENGLPRYRWYNLDAYKYSGDFAIAAREFLKYLKDAVNSHLRADVSVGSCLSGGLDSSSIVCIVNEILKENGVSELQKTFSARSEDAALDEYEFMREVIDSRNIRAFFTIPRFEDLLTLLDELVWHNDEPFTSTSIFAQWNVFRLASENKVKVMLDGQGADEIMAGYHYLFKVYFAELLRNFQILRFIDEKNKFKRIYGYNPLNEYDRLFYYLLPEFIARYGMKGSRSFLLPSWLNREQLNFKPEYPIKRRINGRDLLTEESIILVTHKSLPALLRYEDRDSMAHSVESRVPFLDHRLVEFVINLPCEYKMKEGVTKRVLRSALDGILPEKVRTRTTKIGFATPEEMWMKKHPEVFRNLLEGAIEASKGIIRKEEALSYFDGVIENRIPFSDVIWRWICFGEWIKKFRVNVCKTAMP